MIDPKDANRNFIGRVVGISIILLAVFYWPKPSSETPPIISPKTNFAVVDRYEDRCDVVQWSDNQMAAYKYFLDCTDSMKNK